MTHTLEPDTALALMRFRKQAAGVYVLRSERGGKLSHDIVRLICARAGLAADPELPAQALLRICRN